MRVVMVYSEAGGVSKTTTAVSLAMSAALAGKRVVLIDLDPRGASTKWLGVEPKEKGHHVGAILANDEDTAGFAEELALPTTWSPNLRIIPSSRSVSNREADRVDHSELRLARSLKDLEADVVIIDCPNRQGGMLTLSALNAADTVIYAAKPDVDGVDGYLGAKDSVQKFIESRNRIGAPVNLSEFGIVVSGLPTIPSRIAKFTIAELEATGELIYPIVPERVIVKEMRSTNEWYGNYEKGDPVAAAYAELERKVFA
ncbi:ATPase [Leifsonia sp. Leaf264]|nr:ATPase [Leifsonia sp. Leaf264]